MLKKSIRHHGVTLIELVTGIAIIGILLAIGLPSFTVWMGNSKTRTVAESILNGLQIARAQAVQRNAPVEFVIEGAGWTVQLASDNSVVIQSRSANEDRTDGITVLDGGAAPDVLIFDAFGRASPVVSLTIDNPDLPAADRRTLNVTVSASGSARVCDPSPKLKADDPRRC
ncbi:GspH/FimT family pseudopilin [Thauera butanivorans]|uniref:GspH/FimT family pseudopilin n=1 Tax=Thauera butanivorans TaxID=86174 RepID=UPI001FE02B53|nr:GspH/FimT family protein [Thauera butanivorans]